LLALAGACLALAGCGTSPSAENGLRSSTPAQIVAAAIAAAERAATVHVSGSILGPAQPISLNMELVGHKGGAGHVALAGLSAELVGVDRALYIKGNDALYRRLVGARAARLLTGRWLKGRASDRALAPLLALTSLREVIALALESHGALTRAPAARIDGREAVGVRDRAGGGTLYVAATGTPYPLEVVEPDAHAGRLVFGSWNQAFELEVPTGALSIAQLQSGR
jgi:hypothetical protein